MRNELVEEVKIKSYDNLINMMNVDSANFRQNFIFRGLGNVKYDLIPKAIRKDENEYIIRKYTDSNLLFKVPIDTFFKELNISDDEYEKLSDDEIIVDKFGNLKLDCDEESFEVDNIKKVIIKQELCILSKFLDWADKSGLNVSLNSEIHKLFHNYLNDFPHDFIWPDSRFFELITLAQHYGLPTQSLDWSYDYKIALYFAVRNILNDDTSDSVLWAFNYKPFQQYESYENLPKLQFYRSDYYTNPNFKAQKQLSTFIVNEGYDFDDRSFEKIIIQDVINGLTSINAHKSEMGFKLEGLKKFKLKNGEKLFYKFIIPGDLKHDILNNLYVEGYSEEYIFPGFSGVVQAMKNRIKLDDYYNNLDFDKKDMLFVFEEDKDIENIKNGEKTVIFSDFDFKYGVGKIFIYSKESREVIGYFNGDKIIKNTCEKLWDVFGNESAISLQKFLMDFKGKTECYAVRINHLKIFDYPVPVTNFNFKNRVYYIHNNKQLRFLLNFS